ncbi:MAG: SpoVG family protein [Candidatus Dehalobacter alkaniphilus]|uniref:SpoVG family protein n=1 Tax=Dehalobacter sp. DCM TaxID=2907827 RepID=UPI0030812EB4|nr:SpoVG family protein [Dehalobacter sp. DCM]
MKIKAEMRSIFQNSGKLKAVSNLVLEDSFVVKNVRVIDGKNGLFVSMPSRQNADGRYSDICFPIRSEVREQIEKEVLDAYYEALAKDEQAGDRTDSDAL